MEADASRNPRDRTGIAELKDTPRHVVVHSRTLELECLNCGEKYSPDLPSDVDEYVEAARTWAYEHRLCRKV
jgi:hypothetical protein